MVQHSALLNFIKATISINKLTFNDRISSHRSFAFDAHIEDFYPVLAVGASVHIMPEEIRLDMDGIFNFLTAHNITGGGYITSIATMLLNGYDLKQRYITCGGEALSGVKSNNVEIINAYGPTECTDHSATFSLELGKEYDSIPIGRPLQNAQCLIINNLSKFRKKYNIYVLQPIFDAWVDIEELSHEEIVSRYLMTMVRDILRPCSGQVHGNISCIMGFSYGGELAYHLAVRWYAHTGQKPVAFMGDTVITDVKSDNMQQPAYKDEMEAYYYELQTEFFSKRERLSVPDYQGRVILISAENGSPYRVANEQEWTARNAHINIISVNDNHQGLFENAEHYDKYLSLIEKMS